MEKRGPKFWSLLNCAPCVLMWKRALGAYVLTYQRVLRDYELTCQYALRAHVFSAPTCSRAIMLNNKNKFKNIITGIHFNNK